VPRIRLIAAVALAALLVAATLARASAYTKVLQTYEQTGSIPPCQYSSAQLSSALKGVDTYGAQYFADFTNAIQAALSARASGQCTPGGVPHAPLGGAQARAPAPPSSVTASTDAGVPLPIVLLALLAALCALLGGAVAVSRLRGWDPAWAAAWRHGWDEAGYRAGGLWSEFRDWLRAR
jgi:hypothetical protein